MNSFYNTKLNQVFNKPFSLCILLPSMFMFSLSTKRYSTDKDKDKDDMIHV